MEPTLSFRAASSAVIIMATAVLALAPDVWAQHTQHRRPDDIQQYLRQLDSTDRDAYQKPAQVVEALALKPGMSVADLGSGSGYFTRRFVEAVGESGKVYAIDIELEMLKYARDSIDHMHIPYSAEFILARPDDPKLPLQSVDLIFLSNTYHHLEDRTRYFKNLKGALRAGGRIAIVDFYHDERSGELGFPKEHLVPRDRVIQEMRQAGYRLLHEHGFLARQYFVEFVPE